MGWMRRTRPLSAVDRRARAMSVYDLASWVEVTVSNCGRSARAGEYETALEEATALVSLLTELSRRPR